jgi:S-adenosylmethionine hydrolase
MPDPIITLTTDFGAAAPYAAAMKGVILARNPAARLVDLTHQIPPQDVRHAAFFLASAVPYFPLGTIHVVVVDPGVGTERAILYVEAGGQRLLVPDNGCWTLLAGESPRVIRLTEPRFWRQPVSATFHGRDIFAPVAAHLSLGDDPTLLGQPVGGWVRLPIPAIREGPVSLHGEIIFIDDFGNIITNIPAEGLRKPHFLQIGNTSGFGEGTGFRWVRSYAEAGPGSLVALTSSNGLFEVAVTQGSAAERLGAKVGDAVTVGWAT